MDLYWRRAVKSLEEGEGRVRAAMSLNERIDAFEGYVLAGDDPRALGQYLMLTLDSAMPVEKARALGQWWDLVRGQLDEEREARERQQQATLFVAGVLVVTAATMAAVFLP